MSRNILKRHGVLVGLVFVGLVVVGPVAGQTMYTITDLGTLGGSGGAASALNDHGEVVGCLHTPEGERYAFLWLPEPAYGLSAGLNPIGALAPDGESKALDINDAGQIVGWSHTGETDEQGDPIVHPFLWEDGSFGSRPPPTDCLAV